MWPEDYAAGPEPTAAERAAEDERRAEALRAAEAAAAAREAARAREDERIIAEHMRRLEEYNQTHARTFPGETDPAPGEGPEKRRGGRKSRRHRKSRKGRKGTRRH